MFGSAKETTCPECGYKRVVSFGVTPIYSDKEGNQYHKIGNCPVCKTALLLKINKPGKSWCSPSEWVECKSSDVGSITQTGCICY